MASGWRTRLSGFRHLDCERSGDSGVQEGATASSVTRRRLRARTWACVLLSTAGAIGMLAILLYPLRSLELEITALAADLEQLDVARTVGLAASTSEASSSAIARAGASEDRSYLDIEAEEGAVVPRGAEFDIAGDPGVPREAESEGPTVDGQPSPRAVPPGNNSTEGATKRPATGEPARSARGLSSARSVASMRELVWIAMGVIAILGLGAGSYLSHWVAVASTARENAGPGTETAQRSDEEGGTSVEIDGTGDDDASQLARLAVDHWKVLRLLEQSVPDLPAGKQRAMGAKVRFSTRELSSLLENCRLRLVDYDGQAYSGNLPVVVTNSSDFDGDEDLVIERTLEPVVLREGRILSLGKVVLTRGEADGSGSREVN